MESMPNIRRLQGRKIAILAADGFEKVELVVPLRAPQLAGAKVDVVSLRHGRIGKPIVITLCMGRGSWRPPESSTGAL